MATEEARQLLDALMGGDRNAPLPPGAAMPRSKKKRKQGGGGEMLLLPGKRNKSCFDPDIDPLYCAWGIDVYELFVNTKSDIGPNPYIVDEGARQEFLKLPQPEQERLGFYYFLFQKLQELVRSGDRTITRNKEKLAQELRRLAAKRGANPATQPVVDYVKDVDEQAVEAMARNQLDFEFLQQKLNDNVLVDLEKLQEEEEKVKQELSALLEAQREADAKLQKEAEEAAAKEAAEKEETEGKEGDKPVAEEEAKEGTDETQQQVKAEETPATEESKVKEEQKVKEESTTEAPSDDKPADGTTAEATVKQEDNTTISVPTAEKNPKIPLLQVELGKLTMKKQRVLWEAAKLMSQIVPLQDAMENQHRNLLYVKSDIAVDKTVCEVSGNFMSARDADERIAAHYAGKQYVGWKLVREKFQAMIGKYGRYGPPPPDRSNRGGGGPGGPPPMGMHHGGGGGHRGPPPRGGGGRGGGYGGRGGGPPGGGYGGYGGDRGGPYGGGDRGGGRFGDRGGGFDRGGGGRGRGGYDRGGGPDRGRWERHGPGGPPGFDRRGSRGDGWRR